MAQHPASGTPHDHAHDHGHSHDHAHEHGHTHDHAHSADGLCCEHHNLKLENWIFVYLIGGVLVFATTVMRWLGLAHESIAQIPAAIGAAALGAGLFWSAAKELSKHKVSSSTLAALAILAAFATGEYETAGYLAFILLIVDQALRRTAWGARHAIEQLVKLTPDVARVIENGAEREVPKDAVTTGMVVRVRAGENLPVDGSVVEGRSTINQASLTGESMPVEVQPGSAVYAGTTNLTGTIDLKVTSVGENTTIGKVAALIREAESARTPRQLIIEQVSRYFVPVAIVVAGLVWYLTQDVNRAITVLVVVCPAALLISSPTAMMASFASAARLGIMIKQASYLEAAATIDTVVFDKTGTMTTGVFAVSRLAPVNENDGAALLKSAAEAEQHSNHPLARSIVSTARSARLALDATGQAEEFHGAGVRTRTPSGEIHAGRASWILSLNPGAAEQIKAVEERIEGMTGVHVMRDGAYLGAVGLEDKLRYNAKWVVERLRELDVRRVLLFTGDRFAVAKRVGATVGVDQIEAECLPEEKHMLVRDLVTSGSHVLMVGDGINDGPSLASADVGVAMGLSGSDIATNSAGVALMNDDIGRVPFLISLARRTRAVIAQNIAASVLIAIIGLALAASGVIAVGFAAFYHFIGDIFVIGNSFRLIRFGEEFAGQDAAAAAPRENERTRRAASAGGLAPRPATAG